MYELYKETSLFTILFYITLSIIAALAICEVFFPATVNEGFATLPTTSFWSTFTAPRTDIGPTEEDSRLVRDPRYFNGYTDVSRLGVSYDFCRMVTKKGKDDLFFACALSGTENLDSTSFRTPSVSQGFRISKDDYMRDINNDGRADYCRILLDRDSTYQPLCVRAGDYSFDGREVVDPIPPEDISRLLRFYEGCELWLRFSHSLDDTLNAVSVQTAGGITIDEIPTNPVEGVSFNGRNQYLRLFDGDSTTLGTGVPLRSLRTWMVWVKFTEFTNNAKIFDFGNGANADNVFLGILGKGDYGIQNVNESTVPIEPSGQQHVPETTPRNLMETTDANVNDFECKAIEVFPRKLTPSVVTPNTTPSDRATLLYEVWDKKSRKMSITVNNVIPLKEWTHITITADSEDAFRPALNVYVNGILVFTKSDGSLPSTGLMTNCYLGKSNWKTSSLYSNKDELFKGNLFDFRAYSVSVSSDFINDSFTWGQSILGLQTVE
jgi:hypothetical protein